MKFRHRVRMQEQFEEKDKDCPEGEHWCPQTKKCVPIGQGKGRGGRGMGQGRRKSG